MGEKYGIKVQGCNKELFTLIFSATVYYIEAHLNVLCFNCTFSLLYKGQLVIFYFILHHGLCLMEGHINRLNDNNSTNINGYQFILLTVYNLLT